MFFLSCCNEMTFHKQIMLFRYWNLHNKNFLQEEHKFKEKPPWLDSFVKKTFGDPCRVHVLIKNDRNRYCINCDLAVCQYCIDSGSHNGHNILRLYRHVYQDVVPVSDMAHYIDCSKIQVCDPNKLLKTEY